MTTMGDRIKNLRQELGLTQKELADKVGYGDRTTISRLESGDQRISQDKLVRMAGALGCSTSYLLGTDMDTRIDVEQFYPREEFELEREQAARMAAYIRKAGPGILSESLASAISPEEVRLVKLYRASSEEIRQKVMELLLNEL